MVRYGVDGERWRKVVGCEWRKIRDMGSRGEVRGEFEGAVGGLVGAWIGAVPIPLGKSCFFWFDGRWWEEGGDR